MTCLTPALVALALALGDELPAPPATPAQFARIERLIGFLHYKRYTDAEGQATRWAQAGLVAEGPVAVPQLVRALAQDQPDNPNATIWHAGVALVEIGRRAVGPVRTEWRSLSATGRWKLMWFRGTHDRTAVLPFALGSLASADDNVLAVAIDYLGWGQVEAARRPLLALLHSAAPALRYRVISALGRIGGEGVVEALLPLLRFDSWAARGEGIRVPDKSERAPESWYDGRVWVLAQLRLLKAAEAVPAALEVLRERGPGRAHLGDTIVPFLAECGGLECVPELLRIADAGADGLSDTAGDKPHEVVEQAANAAARILATNA